MNLLYFFVIKHLPKIVWKFSRLCTVSLWSDIKVYYCCKFRVIIMGITLDVVIDIDITRMQTMHPPKAPCTHHPISLHCFCNALMRGKSGADPGILKRGGQFKEKFLLGQQFFFKPNQCNFSDHVLIDDSMTYIVARDSRNG